MFTEDEDYGSVQKSMESIFEVLSPDKCFDKFPRRTLGKFLHIPKGDGIVPPADYANKLLERMYDYADANSIRIE